MALDTKEKRANAARAGRPFLRSKYARGATSEASRIASGNAYGGNALTPGTFNPALVATCNVILIPGVT